MLRTASAHWKGDLKSGGGHVSTQTGVLRETPYSFSSRFEDGSGTNPEELLAAAHAGCFTMALSLQLATAGFPAAALDTKCVISLDKRDDGFAITKSALTLTAKVPGISREEFEKAAMGAKAGCPVSKLFNTEITLSWTLE